ncbi:hypothetical protein PFISCL1PPCAC_12860, partial [Pristionchus fissidentatus]
FEAVANQQHSQLVSPLIQTSIDKMEIQRSLSTLPLDVLIHIVSFLPLPDRVGCRSVARSLLHAEYNQPLVNVSEVALHRSAPAELALFAERAANSHEGPLLACLSGRGPLPKQWLHQGAQYRDRELTTIAHHHIWCWEEARLGRAAGALAELASSARIDVLKLNQLTLTDAVSDELQLSLAHASVGTLFATINCRLNESEKLDWFIQVPSRGLTLYTRRKHADSTFPFSEEFLRSATARLERITLHAKSDRGSTAETTDVVSDSLLLSLLSDRCSCLRLLFCCTSLTAAGVLTVIQHLRSLPGTRGFTVYAKSEVTDHLLQLLQLRPDGPGRALERPQSALDSRREQIVIKDLWMETVYREIRYLHVGGDVNYCTIDDSETSFFKPIAK